MSLQPYRPQRIGNLREHVVLLELVQGYSGSGQPIEEWHHKGRVAARVEPLKGRERFAAQTVTATVDYTVHIRHRTGIKPTWRLVWGDTVAPAPGEPAEDIEVTEGSSIMEVQAVTNPDERRRFLAIDAQVVNP